MELCQCFTSKAVLLRFFSLLSSLFVNLLCRISFYNHPDLLFLQRGKGWHGHKYLWLIKGYTIYHPSFFISVTDLGKLSSLIWKVNGKNGNTSVTLTNDGKSKAQIVDSTNYFLCSIYSEPSRWRFNEPRNGNETFVDLRNCLDHSHRSQTRCSGALEQQRSVTFISTPTMTHIMMMSTDTASTLH